MTLRFTLTTQNLRNKFELYVRSSGLELLTQTSHTGGLSYMYFDRVTFTFDLSAL